MVKKIMGLRIAIIMLFSLVALSACGHNGINAGFSGRTFGREPSIWIAVRSNGFDFDIDNVELEFFFGPPAGSSSAGWENNKFVLFLSSASINLIFSELSAHDGHDDFQNISDHLYFIEEICGHRFYSNEFSTSLSGFRRRRRFSHSQRLTIPREFLSVERGEITFMIAVFHMDEDEKWRAGFTPHIRIPYTLVDSQTVRLSSEIFLSQG